MSDSADSKPRSLSPERKSSRSPSPRGRKASPSPRRSSRSPRRSSRSPARRSSRSPARRSSRSPRRHSRSRSPRRHSRSRSPRGGGVDAGGTKIYIGNISFKTRESDLEYYFEKYGKITDVYIPREPGSDRPRGFAFVTFRDARDAEDAADAMDNRDIDGRAVRVNLARPRGPPPSSSYGRSSRGGGREPCRDFQRGTCSRGDSCRYSHDNGRDRSRSRSRSRSRGRY